MAPAAGVRGGTGKGRSSARADSPGARETSPRRRVPQVRAPVLGQSGVNAGGSRPQRRWSQSSSSLPALLDLRGLAIIRDDLRPRGPALPQPICLAHSAAAPPTPPPAPAMNGAVARTASTGRAEMTSNLATERHAGPAPFGRLAQPRRMAKGGYFFTPAKSGCRSRSRGLPHL